MSNGGVEKVSRTRVAANRRYLIGPTKTVQCRVDGRVAEEQTEGRRLSTHYGISSIIVCGLTPKAVAEGGEVCKSRGTARKGEKKLQLPHTAPGVVFGVSCVCSAVFSLHWPGNSSGSYIGHGMISTGDSFMIVCRPYNAQGATLSVA